MADEKDDVNDFSLDELIEGDGYIPELDELLINHMAAGLSFETFGVRHGINRTTPELNVWVDRYPSFKRAKELGELKMLLFFETEGNHGLWGGKAFNPAVYRLQMLNRTKWIDAKEAKKNPKGLELDDAAKTFTDAVSVLESDALAWNAEKAEKPPKTGRSK